MNSKLNAYGKKHLITYVGAYPHDAEDREQLSNEENCGAPSLFQTKIFGL
jgi:hypothetical protein